MSECDDEKKLSYDHVSKRVMVGLNVDELFQSDSKLLIQMLTLLGTIKENFS